MGELTTHTPKPLLRVGGKYLIEYAIQAFVKAGIHEIVINVSHFAELIMATLGDGSRYQATFTYSIEAERLETGGGIVKALSMLGNQPFVVVSSDIITPFPFVTLPNKLRTLAHLVMVANPHFHPQGDFGITEGLADLDSQFPLTFANIGVYDPLFFREAPPGFFPLNQLLFPAIKQKLISAERFNGQWFNVGTPFDLAACELALSSSSS